MKSIIKLICDSYLYYHIYFETKIGILVSFEGPKIKGKFQNMSQNGHSPLCDVFRWEGDIIINFTNLVRDT